MHTTAAITIPAWQQTVDRFNNLLVSAYVTPSGARFLLLHDGKSDDAIRGFFGDVHELYLRVREDCTAPAPARTTLCKRGVFQGHLQVQKGCVQGHLQVFRCWKRHCSCSCTHAHLQVPGVSPWPPRWLGVLMDTCPGAPPCPKNTGHAQPLPHAHHTHHVQGFRPQGQGPG